MAHLYVYNASNKHFDATLSLNDLVVRSDRMIPPGSQAHYDIPDQKTRDAVVEHLENYGAMPFGWGSGIIHHTEPMNAPTIEMKISPPPKGK